MNRNRKFTARATALLAVSFATALGSVSARAHMLEEVVTHASRAGVVAEQARFEAAMSAFAVEVDAAFKTENRKRITERARPVLRLAQATTKHRG